MTDLLRRFRGLGIALVVLAMSAGVVLAAAPLAQPSTSHGPNAEDPSAGDEDASDAPASEAPESEAPDREAPESEAPETPDAADKQDAETDDGGAHGALVSAAARMTTPAGFRNHGAFVSCVAHLKDATLATIDWTFVTPEACAAAKASKGRRRGQAREGRGEGGAHGGEGRSQGCQGRGQGGEAGREGTLTGADQVAPTRSRRRSGGHRRPGD